MLYSGGMVFLLPYLPLLLDACGFSSQQIGVLSAARPWLSAPCSLLLCRLADSLNAHTAVLALSFGAAVGLRVSLLMVPSTVAVVSAVVLAADCLSGPAGIIIGARLCRGEGPEGTNDECVMQAVLLLALSMTRACCTAARSMHVACPA